MGDRVKPSQDRRRHPRSWSLLGHARVTARLRTGSPLRVLNSSPDGLLVESPARLVPGRQVELMLQSGTAWEQAPWIVIHSRVGCIRGRAELRYRAGLRRMTGTSYPSQVKALAPGNPLPTPARSAIATHGPVPGSTQDSAAGTSFDNPDRT